MRDIYIGYLYNNNYIKPKVKLLVDQKEFGVNQLKVVFISNRIVIVNDGNKDFELNALRQFEYNFITKQFTLLSPPLNKYKIRYSVAMVRSFEEEIEANSDTEAIEIFKKMNSNFTSGTNGKHLKNCEVICIKCEETFIRKVML